VFDLFIEVFFVLVLDTVLGSMLEPRQRDFDPKKFWMRFPPEVSKFMPPHQSMDFRWKFLFWSIRFLHQYSILFIATSVKIGIKLCFVILRYCVV
jgi:hypothetical protein